MHPRSQSAPTTSRARCRLVARLGSRCRSRRRAAERAAPVVVGVFHGFGLQVLGAVDEVFEWVEAEAEVFAGIPGRARGLVWWLVGRGLMRELGREERL